MRRGRGAIGAFLIIIGVILAGAAAQNSTSTSDPVFLDPPTSSNSSFDGYLLTLFWPPTALPLSAQADAKFSILKGYAAPGMWSLGFSPFRNSSPLPTAASSDISSVLPAGCDSTSFPPMLSAQSLADAAPGWNLSLSYYWSLRADRQRLAGDVPFWLALWNAPPGDSGNGNADVSRGGGGACSGLEPLPYFMAAFAASARARDLVEAAVLSPSGSTSSLGVVAAKGGAAAAATESKNAPPLAVDVADAAASLGDALVPGSMLCVLPPPTKNASSSQQQTQMMRLAQFTLCVDKETLGPRACPASWKAEAATLKSSPSLSSSLVPVGGALPTVTSAFSTAHGLSVAPGGVLASCLDDFVSSSTPENPPPPPSASLPRFTVASAKRLIPGLIRSQDPVTFQPLSVWYWTPSFLGLLLLALGALAAAAALAARAGLVPALFAARSDAVRVVRNPDVREPVRVRCEPFDVARWAEVAPALAAVVSDLPVGVGLKGGVARKLLKHRVGATPEPAGTFDVDVAVMLPEALAQSAAAARAAKEALIGKKLGELTLEAQDCEVDSVSEFVEYFVSRDVTLNEVLLLRVRPPDDGKGNNDNGVDSGVLLFYTDQAAADAAAGVIRPSVHARAAPYSFIWDVDSRGRRYVAARPVARSVIRLLKGHGTSYAFDRSTLAHWRRVRLPPSACFQILRPFAGSDAKYRRALDHLVKMGFVSRKEVRRAGGPNGYWGFLLKSINQGAARAGGRLTLIDLDVSAVETWAEKKKASIGAGIVARAAAAPRSGWASSDESALGLGLVECDELTKAFLESPATFDAAAFARARGKSDVAAAAEAAAAAVANGRGEGSSGGDGEGEEEAPAGLADLVKRCAAAATAAAAAESAAGGEGGAKWADPGGGGAAEGEEAGGIEGAAAAATASTKATSSFLSSPSTPLLLLQTSPTPFAPATPLQCARFAWRVVLLSRWHGLLALALTLASLAAQLYVPRAFGRAFSAVVNLDAASFPALFATLGVATLFAAALQFVAAVGVQSYAAAVTRRAWWRFLSNLLRGGGAGASAGFGSSSSGSSGGENLALGEILARMSGDALALRAVVVSAAPAALQGILLAAGATGCVVWRASTFARAGSPGILLATLAALALSCLEGAALARLAWKTSRSARTLLGRLFALTLATLSSARTLSSLGLEPAVAADYGALSRAFFSASFGAGAVTALHAACVAAIGAGLRVAVLWIGGVASVGALATTATAQAPASSSSSLRITSLAAAALPQIAAADIFETLLYSKWLQLGLTMAGKGLAACVEGAPSIARVLELQQREGARSSSGNDKNENDECDEGGALDRDLEPSSVSGGEARAAAASAARLKQRQKQQQQQQQKLGDEEKGIGGAKEEEQGEEEGSHATAETITGAVSLKLRSTSAAAPAAVVISTPGKVTLLVSSSPSLRADVVDALLLRRPPPPGGELLFASSSSPPSSSSSSWLKAPELVVGGSSSSSSSSPRRPISSLDPPEVSAAVEALRSRVALLSPATAHAFSASVEDNVAAATARPTTTKEVSDASEAAGLADWARESLPDGLRTRVGPRTTGPLSRSVAARVALARCLVRKPALLLVDEPAALVAVAGSRVAEVLRMLAAGREEEEGPFAPAAVVLVAAKGAAAEAVGELVDETVDLDALAA